MVLPQLQLKVRRRRITTLPQEEATMPLDTETLHSRKRRDFSIFAENYRCYASTTNAPPNTPPPNFRHDYQY
jgi:phosphopantothenoylcysteine synthetase/decarboxylase